VDPTQPRPGAEVTGRTVELRVHGVSGTSPEDLLGEPVVTQVAGDGLGRFFRPVAPRADGTVLEGYHWALFTSGSWRQGLWFLLLPFGLANLAAHALPAGRTGPERVVALAALRLLGAALTATLALGALTVLVDLVAVQGPGRGRPWAVVTGLAVVVGVLAVVALLGRGRVPAPPPGPQAVVAPDVPRTVLADPGFGAGDPDVPVLRRLHVLVGLLVLAVPGWTAAGLAWVPAAAAAVTGAVVLGLGDPRTPGRWWRRAGPVARRPVAVLAAVGVGAGAVLATVGGRLLVGDTGDRLVGLGGALTTLVVTGAACLVVLLGAVLLGRRGAAPVPAPFRPLAAGLSAWVVAVVAAALGLGFTAGLVWATRRVLGGEVAGVYRATAAGWGVAVVGLAAVGVAVLVARARSAPGRRSRAAASYPPGTDGRVVESAATGLWLAGLRSWAPGVLVGLAALTVLAAGVLLAGLAGVPLPDAEPVGRVLVGVGTVALVGFAVGLLLAGRGAVLHPAVRRGVNVLWDVVAFWPREVHPVVPPPYSRRAVGDVATRVGWLLTRGGADRVTLVGYSQGSLICLAALLQVPPGLRPRVALVTHASQLRLVYARVFPRAVPLALLRWTLGVLDGRWLSLFRATDPFGGPVLAWGRSPDGGLLTSTRLTADGQDDGVDVVGADGVRVSGTEWRLPDPAVVDPQERPWPGRRGHTDHTRDPAWPAALAAVWRPPGG